MIFFVSLLLLNLINAQKQTSSHLNSNDCDCNKNVPFITSNNYDYNIEKSSICSKCNYKFSYPIGYNYVTISYSYTSNITLLVYQNDIMIGMCLNVYECYKTFPINSEYATEIEIKSQSQSQSQNDSDTIWATDYHMIYFGYYMPLNKCSMFPQYNSILPNEIISGCTYVYNVPYGSFYLNLQTLSPVRLIVESNSNVLYDEFTNSTTELFFDNFYDATITLSNSDNPVTIPINQFSILPTNTENLQTNTILSIKNTENLIESLNSNILELKNTLESYIALNASILESYVISNKSVLESYIALNASVLESYIALNASILESYVALNGSILESYVISNKSILESYIALNASILESYVISNKSILESYIALNASLLESYINLLKFYIISNTSFLESHIISNTNLLELYMISNVSFLESYINALESYMISNVSLLESYMISNVSLLESYMISNVSLLESYMISNVSLLNNYILLINSNFIKLNNSVSLQLSSFNEKLNHLEYLYNTTHISYLFSIIAITCSTFTVVLIIIISVLLLMRYKRIKNMTFLNETYQDDFLLNTK